MKLTNLHPKEYHQVYKQNAQNQNQREAKKIPNQLPIKIDIVLPKNDSIPQHDVIVLRSTADTGGRILLQPLEIPHQSFPRRR